MSSRVREGQRAPDFALRTQDGRELALHDYYGKMNVVVYFYPKDFTMGCTAETKTFGDAYSELQALGAEVIGVSSDSTESHGEFARECGVGFPLVSDVGGRVRKEYGVEGTLGIVPGRVTFVIDKEGFVRRVFSSQLNPRRHVKEAVEALRKIG